MNEEEYDCETCPVCEQQVDEREIETYDSDTFKETATLCLECRGNFERDTGQTIDCNVLGIVPFVILQAWIRTQLDCFLVCKGYLPWREIHTGWRPGDKAAQEEEETMHWRKIATEHIGALILLLMLLSFLIGLWSGGGK